MTITRFVPVGLGGKKNYKCACGKRVVRSRRFEQTLNPWNKNPDGSIKTQGQIMTECSSQFVAWQKTVEPCTHIYARPIKKEACTHPHKRPCGYCTEWFCPNDGCDPNHVEFCREAMKP